MEEYDSIFRAKDGDVLLRNVSIYLRVYTVS
jgi:hypothetical protein